MPFPDGPESGVRSPFSNRVGLDLEKFRGTNRQGDPGSIGEDQYHILQNVRLDGTGIKCRPGLSEVFQNAMESCVWGLWDDRNPNDDGNALFDVNTLGYGPQVWDDNYSAPIGDKRIRGTLNGQTILLNDLGTGYAFTYTTTPEGVPSFLSTEVFNYFSTLTNAAIRSAVEFDGALYFLYSTGDTGEAEIHKWTGGAEAILEETITGITSVFCVLATDNEDLYLAQSGGVRKRNGGSWDALVMPVGAGTNWTPVGWSGIQRPPYIYFSGYDADEALADQVMIILQVIGETVTVANNSVPTWSGTVNNYGAIDELNGQLYIIGMTTQGVDNFTLYQISGSNVAIALVDLTAALGLVSDASNAWLQIFAWRNQLFLSAPTGGIGEASFAKSEIGDPTTWSEIAGDAVTGASGDGRPLFTA